MSKNKTQQITELVMSTAPRAFWKILVARLSRGQGYYLTCGQIEAESRLAAKVDPEVAADLRNYVESVYAAEAEACEVSVKTAQYMLLRGVALSRMVAARGSDLYYSVASGRQPWVTPKAMVMALAILQDDGPGELPETPEEAEFITGGTYQMCQPGYVRALRAHLDGDKGWGAVVAAHNAAATAWEETLEDRQALATTVEAVLADTVAAAKADVPAAFITGDDIHDFIAGWCPELLGAVSTTEEAL